MNAAGPQRIIYVSRIPRTNEVSQCDIVIRHHSLDLVELGEMRCVSSLISADHHKLSSLECRCEAKRNTEAEASSPEHPIDRVQFRRLETPFLLGDLVQHVRRDSRRMRPQ